MTETIGNTRRTHYCGEFTTANIGETVTVCGWVQRQRDKGSLIFIDLRDVKGVVQLLFNETTEKGIFEKAFKTRAEYVIMASGKVQMRSSVNNDIPTGQVEIFVTEFKIVSIAKTPPFEIVENSNVKEELLLKYRYLDLRRPDLQQKIVTRHKVTQFTRNFFDNENFIEIETPMLIKSTPEGARDYLVPSRVFKGHFFALPQSPQIYKQLLIVSGFDRYMQIVKCFRDEDLRADRQPEFTQIDLEMSFVSQEDVMDLNEIYFKALFKKFKGLDLSEAFLRLPYKQAMERFGSDKPDMRFDMELVDISETVANCGFNVFTDPINNGGSVRAIVAKNSADMFSRKAIDKLVSFVKDFGAKGLAYTKITSEGTTSSYEKNLDESTVNAIRDKLHADNNDIIFIIADSKNNVVFNALGALRLEVAKQTNIIDKSIYKFIWVTDFPMFEYNEEDNRYVAVHHPFTAIHECDIEKLETNPAEVLSYAYDLVLNGMELGSGSIRISLPELQQRVFNAIGFTKEEVSERFGFLIDAYQYGAPPHGGIAFGLDRLCMVIGDTDSIRDVVAFPKVQNSSELMSAAPSVVLQKDLDYLGLSITK